MKYTPVPVEQVQKTSQLTLAFLDSPGANVPGNLIEGVVSCKSMLRSLISGTLVLCQQTADAPAKEPPAKKSQKPSKEAT